MRCLLFASLVALSASLLIPEAVHGQGDPAVLENHYLVYEVPEVFNVTDNIQLDDQFGQSNHTQLLLEKFANPVDKNGEGIPHPLIHHIWWEIDNPEPVKRVELDNQFGRQTWTVTNGRYLLTPASKNDPSGTPPPEPANHYKCYEAMGPIVDQSVMLQDQFIGFTGLVMEPMFFCNPTTKTVADGTEFPPVDETVHLACYKVDPMMPVDAPLTAIDQFGSWQITAHMTEWLCVPTEKLQFVPVQEDTWGRIKKMYRD